MITDEERASFGYLGRPPDALLKASHRTVRQWKDLCVRARQVAKLPNTPSKVKKAKEIERQYHALVYAAEMEAKGRE